MDSVNQNILLRIVAKIAEKIREAQQNFDDIHPFAVRGEAGWEVSVAYIKRGTYQFTTYDPFAARQMGDRTFLVTGEFEYLEPGDVTGEAAGGTLRPRFNISTDFSYMIEHMAAIMEYFEAIMQIPVRFGNADPNGDRPTAR